MILASFIAQLRANAPMFGGRVAGAAEYAAALRDYTTSLALPAAYVLPLDQEVESGAPTWGGLQQLVHVGVGVAVELDAQTDRRGQAPAMDLDAVRDQLFGAVLNYQMDDCHVARGVYYTGAHGLNLDRGRLFYQFNFGVDWQITDADGWQVAGVPIVSLELDGFKAPVAPGDMPAFVAMVATSDPTTPMPPPTNGPWPAAQQQRRRGLFSRLVRAR